jgi:type IV pilus assembly protein PilF
LINNSGTRPNHEVAEKQYLLALKADPNNASAHNNYGNLLLQIWRKKEAGKHYQLALKADPIMQTYTIIMVLCSKR